MHRVVLLFFFLSGFSSLVFEVLWERMLMQVFGSTTFAISTLLTAFMAGLALGSFIGGKYAKKLKNPLMVYGLLEGSIGLYALLVPMMLKHLPSVYGLFFDVFLDNFYLFSLLRFLAVFVILILPTTLMGATLPIVSQWITRHEALFQGSIGLLYGMNTLGACAGCFSAGFILLPALGLSSTNFIFALSNFALCALVLVSRKTFLEAKKLQANREKKDELLESLEDIGELTRVVEIPGKNQKLALFSFALFGALSMCYQVLWTRGYVIVLGSSTYSFTVILVSFLIGLSAGSAALSLMVKRIARPLYWLGATQLLLALFATLTFFTIDRLPELLFHRLRDSVSTANEIYAFNFLLVGALVFVPTMLQGMSFPLMIRALVSDREDAGARVGNIYAFNTMGSIIGSFSAGFILLPWLGLSASMAAIITASILGAALLLLMELLGYQKQTQRTPQTRYTMLAVSLFVGATSIAMLAPPIDRVKLTRGLFRAYWARELFDAKKLKKDRPELLFYKDGITVTTSVEKRGRYVTLKGNGKAEASDGADMATQILVGLTPFIFHAVNHPDTIGQEKSVMIGYGSGVTAGGSLQWPLKSIEVIEIEEAMIKASSFFDHVNHKPLEDPRVDLIISDGRNFLEYNDNLYDVIVSEPSNPWIAGVASLFTVEHFQRAKRHLKPGGVFGQWVQLYEMDPQNVRVIFASFAQAFDHVQVFSSMPKGTDLILIGSNEPIPMPADGFQEAMKIDSVKKELHRAGIKDMYDFYGLMFMSHQEFLDFAKGAPLNTDDNGYLEFAAPKDLVRYDVGEQFFTERYHSRDDYGDPRKALEHWGDKTVWTELRVAHLARGLWKAGKYSLSKEVVDEFFGDTKTERLSQIQAPFGPMDEILLVHHAESLDIDQAMAHLWPTPEHPLATMVVDAALNAKATQAIQYLESQERPTRQGYPLEKGLFYGYLLGKRGYWKFALRQLQELEKEAPEHITQNPLLWLLKGQTTTKRLRYNESYKSYLNAGKLLLTQKEQPSLQEPPATP